MRRVTRKNTINSDINIVPYIDIMLVLLVIFMLNTSVSHTKIQVDLPQSKYIKSDNDVTSKSPEPFVISIKDNNNYYLSTSYGNKPTTIENIKKEITYLVTKDNNTTIYIRADKNVDYGSVIIMLDTIKLLGIKNINLVTLKKDND